jgi:hypothetical protein
MSYLFTDEIGFKGNAIDAFNRLKVSQPFTIFDSQNRYKENGYFDTLVASGGTHSYAINESAINSTVNGTTGSKVFRETKRVFPYQPGKSLLVLNTFAMAAKTTGLRQRIGYFGLENGIYLEQSDDLYLVLRSKVSGSIDDSTRKIPQSQWNGDKFDGTGASGRILDITKANILWMDIEWLGVGDVRCGFFVDGRPVVAHTFHNDNLYSSVYMTTACLPIRSEIENLTGATSSSTLKTICSSVLSEAGYEGFTKKFSINKTGSSSISLSSQGVQYPIIALRLNSSRLDSIVIPANLNVVLEETTNNKLNVALYKVYLNPVLTGNTWVTHIGGNVDYNISMTATTGGTEIISGYVTSQNPLEISGINNFNYQLGRTQGNTSDIFAITLTPIFASSLAYADLSWFELI